MIRLVILVVSFGFFLFGCGSGDYSQPAAMLEESLNCPEGSQSEISRWGGIDENGWSHSCKMTHGKFHVWRNGYLAIQGSYVNGKKEGDWVFSDENGAIKKIIVYEAGEPISDSSKN